ncbi:hypothetical protein EWM64_g4146 [Hericium alpestre]|uniref:DUF6593 domain-containing protein n=1 Tax=Hericium alpestre TaxID=135208 RepID=A0A4Z0A0L6_9AGAM|nr:hypothetical protein EWM64_g4146 [Hericium alpestre]
MILTLTEKDYLNTLLKDEEGRVLYQINTPSTVFGGRTTISRLEDETHQDIAQFDWNTFSADELQQQGETVDAKVHLHRSGIFSLYVPSAPATRRPLIASRLRKREFFASNGEFYVWKEGRNGLKLDPARSAGLRIAEYHVRSLGILSKKHPGYIEIADGGLPILDDIVTSFVYVEKQRQSRQGVIKSAAYSAGGQGAS